MPQLNTLCCGADSSNRSFFVKSGNMPVFKSQTVGFCPPTSTASGYTLNSFGQWIYLNGRKWSNRQRGRETYPEEKQNKKQTKRRVKLCRWGCLLQGCPFSFLSYKGCKLPQVFVFLLLLKGCLHNLQKVAASLNQNTSQANALCCPLL